METVKVMIRDGVYMDKSGQLALLELGEIDGEDVKAVRVTTLNREGLVVSDVVRMDDDNGVINLGGHVYHSEFLGELEE
jgi:hypothetical protein